MTNSALILGNGISGLLLALTLLKKQWRVTVISHASADPGDSPLICPELVMNFLEELIPGSREELKSKGTRHTTHAEMIRSKFPEARARNEGEFFFLGRILLLQFLSLHAEKAGAIVIEEKTTALMTNKDQVIGIVTGDKNIKADFVFDCTGTFSARSGWLKGLVRTGEILKTSGRDEIMFLRFYESSGKPHLRLRSGEEFRGGIYPMEGNRFAISMIVRAANSPGNPENLIEKFITFIGAEDDFLGSSSTGPWIRRDNIINRASNFYLSGLTREIRNFYIVGDGLLFSNPVYGRGIALTVLQLKAIQDASADHESLSAGLTHGFRTALKKWAEVAKEKNSIAHKILRKFYLYLLERDPGTYELFLEFYQLRLTPMNLLAGIFLSIYTIKRITLLVLMLSGLVWILAFFPR